MNKKELEILERTLKMADGYFDAFCEVTDSHVLSQEEIDLLEDEQQKEEAQEALEFDELLKKSQEIIEKHINN